MIDAGFELPGVSHLKKSLEILKAEGIDVSGWTHTGTHEESWGDAAGDTKVEYISPEGRSVVLKLKTAPDEAGGILDQYELGPYNLMILGKPSRWRSELRAFFGAGITQTVTTMSPCSVLVARNSFDRHGYFICTDGSSRSLQAVRRSAVLAAMTGQPITLFSAAPDAEALPAAEEAVNNAKALLKAMKIDVADVKTAVGDVIEEIVERGSLYRMIVVTDEGLGLVRVVGAFGLAQQRGDPRQHLVVGHGRQARAPGRLRPARARSAGSGAQRAASRRAGRPSAPVSAVTPGSAARAVPVTVTSADCTRT